MDFTADKVAFTPPKLPSPGTFWPSSTPAPLVCPPGAYCPAGSQNITLCPAGTYQPMSAAHACVRCPIGFHCPEQGLVVPRACPAGRVCDVTGTSHADQLCPEGHFCLEVRRVKSFSLVAATTFHSLAHLTYTLELQGTATTATTCGHPIPSSRMQGSITQAERLSTMRAGRVPHGLETVLGARNSICW